ncbi:RBPJ-interacting and tubulin-associated protein 1 [Rhynochetos jubatus]
MRAAATASPLSSGSGAASRSRGRGVRRARASFVDESLFGSPAGARPAPPGFAPPWAAAPGGGPRPRNKCRHAPSYCDESLFGAKRQGPAGAAPWVRKEDVAKLHPLLWGPPPAPRSQPSLSLCSRETPVRAVHPPATPAAAGFGGDRTGKSCLWKHPESGSGSEGPGAPGRACSQPLSRLNAPSDGLRLASDTPRAGRCKNQSPLTAPATPRGWLMRGRSKSLSTPALAVTSEAAGGCSARPPWK